MEITKILFSVLIISLAVMVNLALFGFIGPKVLLGYGIGGLCSFWLLSIWS